MSPTVHPSAFVGPGVSLGRDVVIGPFASVTGPCQIGDRVWIGPGARLGGPPEISSLRQNAAWDDDLDHAGVIIADDVVIRENVVIHQGSHRPTRVGDGCWLLNSCYLAHDVQLGAAVTISAGVSIGGHAEIGSYANLGMNAAVHQRRRVGAGAMIGMSTPVARDIPPYAKVYGAPPRLADVNAVGLSRRGVPDSVIETLRANYLHGTALPTSRGEEWTQVETDVRWWESLDDPRPVLPLGAGA